VLVTLAKIHSLGSEIFATYGKLKTDNCLDYAVGRNSPAEIHATFYWRLFFPDSSFPIQNGP